MKNATVLVLGGLCLSPIVTKAAPTVQTVYPPTLVQRVGDHAAFNAVASGTGTLTYQWTFQGAGQGLTILNGQTAGTLVLTNLAAAQAGTYGVLVTDSTGTASGTATLGVSSQYFALSGANIVLARIGDGAQPLSLAAGNTLYLDQYSPQGTYLNSLMIPDETTPGVPAPGPALLVVGAGSDAVYHGVLTVSGNNEFINLAGYNEVFPNTGSDATLAGPHSRGIYEVNAFGFPGLAYTNAGLYSGGNHTIRGSASSDGLTNFWSTGQAGAGGIKFVNSTVASYATGNGIPVVSSSGTGCRVAQVVQGSLLYTDWSGSGGAGIFTANGLPEPAPSGTSPSSLFLLEGGHPVDFAVSPDGATIYISDDQPFSSTNTQSGGIERWDTNTMAGGYAFSYALPTIGTNGARGLAVDFSAHAQWGSGVQGASLFATTATSVTNSLVKIVDNGPSSASSIIVTAGPNELFSGVRFGPTASAPVAISSQPQHVAVTRGSNAVFTVSAYTPGGPFSYQWYIGNTPLTNGPTGTGSVIFGATTSTLTVSNVSAADTTNYTARVSNPATSQLSSPAFLDLVITITNQPVSVSAQPGQTVTFTAGATGNGQLNYQWEKNGAPLTDGNNISGSATRTLTVTNVQNADIAGYSVVISDNFGTTNTSQEGYLELAPLGNGTGLLGQYWNNQKETANAPPVFTGPPTLTRVDPEINFNFGTTPPAPSLLNTNYAVIWSGLVEPLYSDTYTFYTVSDDGCNLFVNGQQLVSDWVTQSAKTNSGSITLQAGQQYSIVMQYFQATGVAVAQLAWSATFEPFQIIPQSQLFPAAPPSFVTEPTNFVAINAGDTLVIDGGDLSGNAPFTYQWFSNSVPLAGQTNLTLVLSNVPAALNSQNLTLVVSNSFGSATSAGTIVNVSSGAPTISTDIQASENEALDGSTVTFTVVVNGNLPSYQWRFNGTNLSDTGRIVGSHSNILTIVQALASDAGTYQLIMSNSLGTNQSSSTTLSVSRITLNDGIDWVVNGNSYTPQIASNTLEITDGGQSEQVSAWANSPVYVGAFISTFTYQATPGASAGVGITWTLQNAATGTRALGGTGANLGYSGITPSASFQLNIWTGGQGGVGYGFDTNGLTGQAVGAGGQTGEPYSPTGNVNIASGDPINITLQYLNGVLSMSMTDTVAGTSFSASKTENLPSILGTNFAYVGFTAGTSTFSTEQTISNFLFSPLPTLSVQNNGNGTALVTWPSGPAAGFVLQQNSTASSTGWTNVSATPILTNGLYEVTVSPATSEFYKLSLP